jgi:hypothetical protein
MTQENLELKQDDIAPSVTDGTKETTPAVPADDKVSELVETISMLTTAYEKVTKDSENYQKGMLEAKRKLKENGVEDEQELDDDRISRVVSSLLDSKLSPILERLTPKDDLVSKATRQVEELKTALLNRNQVSNTGSVSTGEDTKVKDSYFSEAQLAELKKRGVDPDKVRQTMISLKDRQKL